MKPSFSDKMWIYPVVLLASVATLASCQLQYCDSDCKAGNGYFCVKNNASAFSVCANGNRMGTIYCQNGLVFDVSQSACNWPSEIKGEQCPCNAPTTPGPTTPFTTVTYPPFTGTPPVTRPPAPSGFQRACYFTNWSQARKGPASYTPADVDPFMCTHIIVAFMNLKGGRILYLEKNDGETLAALTKLRNEKNPALKILIAIGGWDAGSGPFIEVVQSDSSMYAFIYQAIDFLRQHDLDGLDIDWEYPTGYVSQYSLWMQRIRSSFEQEAASTGQSRLLLTAAVAAGTQNINYAYDVPILSETVDYIFLMSYDLNGPWSPATGLNSGIAGGEPLSVQFAANYWISKGANRDKLVIGVPTYGRTFKLCNASSNGMGARACGAGEQGAYTVSAGFEAHYESCLKLQCNTTKWTSVWVNNGQAPYMYSGNQWISYENVASIAAKVNFAKSNNFGGVMVWALDLDDFNDICGYGVKSPLMSSLVAAATGQPLPTLNANPNPQVNPCDPLGSGSGGGSSGGGSSTTCDNNCAVTGYYCIPGSPAQFYQCANGIRYPAVTCQGGLLYNYKKQQCDWPENYPGCVCPTVARRRSDDVDNEEQISVEPLFRHPQHRFRHRPMARDYLNEIESNM